MDSENPSAQGSDGVEKSGLQARIDEIIAKQRQAEERAQSAEKQLLETNARVAEMAIQANRPAAPVFAPVDPLAQFKDSLDPVAAQAIAAAVAETQRRMEAQYAPMFAQHAAQLAGMQVQAEAAAIPNLPKEVQQRAATLAAQWRQAGLNFPPGDALNFALGEYQRGQLLKAAPVMGYNPAAQQPTNVTPGFIPTPAAPRSNALPANFDSLSRAQQNQLLESSGILDQPL